MEPPLTPLIKSKHNDNQDKDFVKLKLHRDTTSEKLDLYELKMALFNNGKTEEFLLFVRNFNMTLEASGNMYPAGNDQYPRTLVSGEALRQFESLYSDV